VDSEVCQLITTILSDSILPCRPKPTIWRD